MLACADGVECGRSPGVEERYCRAVEIQFADRIAAANRHDAQCPTLKGHAVSNVVGVSDINDAAESAGERAVDFEGGADVGHVNVIRVEIDLSGAGGLEHQASGDDGSTVCFK